jgi:hypothetical protein
LEVIPTYKVNKLTELLPQNYKTTPAGFQQNKHH